MKELMFEEKGTWVKLNLNGIKHLWDSNELDYRKWPDQISKSYAIELLELSKIATSKEDCTRNCLEICNGLIVKKNLNT
jgi:hypothetical protein